MAAPGQVEPLHPVAEGRVQSPEFAEQVGADEHAGHRDAQHVAALVELSLVELSGDRVTGAAVAGDRLADRDEVAGVLGLDQFGADDADTGRPGGRIDQLGERLGIRERVVVQQPPPPALPGIQVGGGIGQDRMQRRFVRTVEGVADQEARSVADEGVVAGLGDLGVVAFQTGDDDALRAPGLGRERVEHVGDDRTPRMGQQHDGDVVHRRATTITRQTSW